MTPRKHIFIPRLECPSCRSPDLRVYRTITSDEEIQRYTRCKTCGHCFCVHVVQEIFSDSYHPVAKASFQRRTT